jgi:hypothetical protein
MLEVKGMKDNVAKLVKMETVEESNKRELEI